MRRYPHQTARNQFYWDGENAEGWTKGGFVHSGLRFHAGRTEDDGQQSLWEDRVILDEVFYDALRQHPVPLREASLRELSNRSASLDLYIWLAYRLHRLTKPTPVRWAALQEQFGAHYTRASHFRRDFRLALAPAVAAYSQARVEFDGDAGLILRPSPPPVALRLA